MSHSPRFKNYQVMDSAMSSLIPPALLPHLLPSLGYFKAISDTMCFYKYFHNAINTFSSSPVIPSYH